jgi:hypothetical protein
MADDQRISCLGEILATENLEVSFFVHSGHCLARRKATIED